MKKLILIIGLAFILPVTLYAATGANHNLPDCAKYGFTCIGDQTTMSLAEYKAKQAQRTVPVVVQPKTTVVKKTVAPTKNVYPPFPGVRMCLR